MTEVYTIVLPWVTPPLTLNQRLHYMAEHRAKTDIKRATMVLARSLGFPKMRAVTAELVWLKSDNRPADPDNISPTMKPALDGLVAAGCLPEDNANHVLRTSQTILLKRDHNTKGGRLLLRIHDVSGLVAKSPG